MHDPIKKKKKKKTNNKIIPHFVLLYINYKMVKSETKQEYWAWRYSFIYKVDTLDEKRTKYRSVFY